MKKLLGVIPFLIYLGETLFLGFFAFLIFTMFKQLDGGNDAIVELFEASFELYGIIFGIVVAFMALVPLLLTIFKGIHLATGAGVFGVVCIIADIAALVLSVVVGGKSDLLAFAVIVFVSLICNILSLGKKA